MERLRDTRQVDMQSLNEIVGSADSDGAELLDFIADDVSDTPDRMMIKVEDVDQLLELLDKLSERERQVLRLRFGLDGTPVQTLDQVGKMLNCTNERVRQIQNQALRRLFRMMTANA